VSAAPEVLGVPWCSERKMNVTIRIYRESGSAGDRARRLVRTVRLAESSGKRLTASRASRILAREVPGYAHPVVIATAEGFRAQRAIEVRLPDQHPCDWEVVLLSEE
jgi:hypothetical protein